MEAVCGVKDRHEPLFFPPYRLCRDPGDHAGHRHMAVDQVKRFIKHELFQCQVAGADGRREGGAAERDVVADDSCSVQPAVIRAINDRIKISSIVNLISKMLQNFYVIHFKLRDKTAYPRDDQCFFHKSPLSLFQTPNLRKIDMGYGSTIYIPKESRHIAWKGLLSSIL